MDAISRMVEAIKKDIESKSERKTTLICKVVTPPPNITISYMENIIPTEQILVANELLLNYNRKYKLIGNIIEETQDVDYEFNNDSSDMTPAGSGPHKHNLLKLKGSGTIKTKNGTYEHTGELFLESTLEVGSLVLTHLVGNSWVIVSQIVQMPNNAFKGA